MHARRISQTLGRRGLALLLPAAITLGGFGALGAPPLGALDTTGDVSVAGAVVDVPPTIDATGATEVSAALQEFLTTVPSGTPEAPTTVRFAPGGTYWVDATLMLRKGARFGGVGGTQWPAIGPFELHDVRLDLAGATLEQRSTAAFRRGYRAGTTTVSPVEPRRRWGNPIVHTGGASGIEITSGTLRGSNPGPYFNAPREAWAGIVVSGDRSDGSAGRIWIHDLTVEHVWGDFVYLASRTALGEELTDVRIEDNVMDVAGRHGIVFHGGSGVTIARNELRRVARITFDSEPGRAHGWRDLVIRDNRGTAGRLGYFQHIGPKDSVAGQLTIVGNTLSAGNFVVHLSGGKTTRSGFRFEDNHNLGVDVFRPHGKVRSLVTAWGWIDVRIVGNTNAVLDNGRITAVRLFRSPEPVIAGNCFDGAIDDQCPS